MKSTSLRFFLPVLAVLLLLGVSTRPTSASSGRYDRDVRLVAIFGDVRLSRGHNHRTDLKQPWDQGEAGESIEQGFTLATGKNSTAEIELENGSTVFLAENSLLMINDLSVDDHDLVTWFTLPTGSAAVWLPEGDNELIHIDTPTDSTEFSSRDLYFARVDAYLDATAITYLGLKDRPTVFYYDGDPIRTNDPDATRSLSLHMCPNCTASQPKDAGDATLDGVGTLPNRMLPANFTPLQSLASSAALSIENDRPSPLSVFGHSTSTPWDLSVMARVQQKETAMVNALKASGLSAPEPGLTELSAHGTFFTCAPYGVCWEPEEQEFSDAGILDIASHDISSPYESARNAYSPNEISPDISSRDLSSRAQQSPLASASSNNFPLTVSWIARSWGPCGSSSYRRFSRVAHNDAELDALLRMKGAVESANLSGFARGWSRGVCQLHTWIPQGRHYAMVLRRYCPGGKCSPIHPPRPVRVRSSGKVGLLLAHPDDVPGKPPINLKNGPLLPPSSPREPVQRAAAEHPGNLQVLGKSPASAAQLVAAHPAVAAPELQAHLMQEATRANSPSASNRSAPPQIAFDFRTQEFRMPATAGAAEKGKSVAIGSINSKGIITTFANGGSQRYATSFTHTVAAASYHGTGHSGTGSSHSSGGHGGGGSTHGGGAGGGGHGGGSGGSSGGGSGHGGGSSGGSSSGGSSGGGGHGH
jgi:hypothetical protein